MKHLAIIIDSQHGQVNAVLQEIHEAPEDRGMTDRLYQFGPQALEVGGRVDSGVYTVALPARQIYLPSGLPYRVSFDMNDFPGGVAEQLADAWKSIMQGRLLELRQELENKAAAAAPVQGVFPLNTGTVTPQPTVPVVPAGEW